MVAGVDGHLRSATRLQADAAHPLLNPTLACIVVILAVTRPSALDTNTLVLDASTRDEPVYLSGYRFGTHQQRSPAGANCCQSLLLDPDATMRIGLHKRLFLLVTGRGE
jgi:hypothetical protein